MLRGVFRLRWAVAEVEPNDRVSAAVAIPLATFSHYAGWYGSLTHRMEFRREVPDPTARATLKSLTLAIRTARGALSGSNLGQRERQRILVQLVIIDRISQTPIPDWTHIDSLVSRLLYILGDRVPGVTSPLQAWKKDNRPP